MLYEVNICRSLSQMSASGFNLCFYPTADLICMPIKTISCSVLHCDFLAI